MKVVATRVRRVFVMYEGWQGWWNSDEWAAIALHAPLVVQGREEVGSSVIVGIEGRWKFTKNEVGRNGCMVEGVVDDRSCAICFLGITNQ